MVSCNFPRKSLFQERKELGVAEGEIAYEFKGEITDHVSNSDDRMLVSSACSLCLYAYNTLYIRI